MKKNYSHITVILDRSGSMNSVRNDIVGGFNAFLTEQKTIDGDCTVTLVQFDGQEPYDILRDFVPLAKVQPLGNEYEPRGSTPLYDAIGQGVTRTGNRLSALPEDERPDKVLFVILTDGHENASKEFTKTQIAEITKHQTEKYNWQFIYLGANQDGMAEGMKAGFSQHTSATYDQMNTAGAFQACAKKMSAYRGSGNLKDLEWTAADRKSLA